MPDLVIMWYTIKVLIEILMVILLAPIIIYVIYKSFKKERYSYFSQVLKETVYYSTYERNSATKTFRLYNKQRFRYTPKSKIFMTGTLFSDEDSIEMALKEGKVSFYN